MPIRQDSVQEDVAVLSGARPWWPHLPRDISTFRLTPLFVPQRSPPHPIPLSPVSRKLWWSRNPPTRTMGVVGVVYTHAPWGLAWSHSGTT